MLLVQPTKRPEGRTYADYESVNECLEGKHVTALFIPSSLSVGYDTHLFKSIVLPFRYRANTQTYQPYNKDWIKEKIYMLLRCQAQQTAKS
uniref:Enhancer of rudimentary homolog n=1 Tax=Fundulus heteroclitus TaxID=8078 RepID=A0A3Q2P9I0_FUNHE